MTPFRRNRAGKRIRRLILSLIRSSGVPPELLQPVQILEIGKISPANTAILTGEHLPQTVAVYARRWHILADRWPMDSTLLAACPGRDFSSDMIIVIDQG
jgi:hypothetical protein